MGRTEPVHAIKFITQNTIEERINQLLQEKSDIFDDVIEGAVEVRNKLKKISSSDRLRLCISRSTKNISAQIIDDKNHSTILSASSTEKEMKSIKKNKYQSNFICQSKSR